MPNIGRVAVKWHCYHGIVIMVVLSWLLYEWLVSVAVRLSVAECITSLDYPSTYIPSFLQVLWVSIQCQFYVRAFLPAEHLSSRTTVRKGRKTLWTGQKCVKINLEI